MLTASSRSVTLVLQEWPSMTHQRLYFGQIMSQQDGTGLLNCVDHFFLSTHQLSIYGALAASLLSY
nr:hypothetical protein Iba_chr14bCG11400 [Ipomoea batatas]GMD93473.1 hypothetical protein Iba_chr14fCG7790 [Ipomoea batatas]